MKDMEKLCGIIADELNKIAEKGLNTGNLETAYKLIDMYKDLKNTEYWDQKGEYYMAVLEEMQGGYSQNDGYSMTDYSQRRGQRRDSLGRYSRDGGYSRNSYDVGESYGDESFARGERGYNGRGYSRAGVGYSGDGGYSGNYDRYMESKQSYRTNKSPDCKQRLMETLEDYMENISRQMEEMLRDSDCQEERATIKRYLEKVKTIV